MFNNNKLPADDDAVPSPRSLFHLLARLPFVSRSSRRDALRARRCDARKPGESRAHARRCCGLATLWSLEALLLQAQGWGLPNCEFDSAARYLLYLPFIGHLRAPRVLIATALGAVGQG